MRSLPALGTEENRNHRCHGRRWQQYPCRPRGSEVCGYFPRLNEDVNEEWISDKTRFACDGSKAPASGYALYRGADGKLAAASWDEAFAAIANRVKPLDGSKLRRSPAISVDAESMFALKN